MDPPAQAGQLRRREPPAARQRAPLDDARGHRRREVARALTEESARTIIFKGSGSAASMPAQEPVHWGPIWPCLRLPERDFVPPRATQAWQLFKITAHKTKILRVEFPEKLPILKSYQTTGT